MFQKGKSKDSVDLHAIIHVSDFHLKILKYCFIDYNRVQAFGVHILHTTDAPIISTISFPSGTMLISCTTSAFKSVLAEPVSTTYCERKINNRIARHLQYQKGAIRS